VLTDLEKINERLLNEMKSIKDNSERVIQIKGKLILKKESPFLSSVFVIPDDVPDGSEGLKMSDEEEVILTKEKDLLEEAIRKSFPLVEELKTEKTHLSRTLEMLDSLRSKIVSKMEK